MDWGIIGAGVRPADAAQRERLAAQDYLTTLVELNPEGSVAEVVGSMIGFVAIEEDNANLIAQMAKPEIRIVSLTVTEGGYFLDPATKSFDMAHPDIQFDAANPGRPRTVFGAMIAALRIRRADNIGPFTCQSCDNLQGNGDILRQTLVSLARLSDRALADWIDTNCSFPNAMVDCIVPATGPREIELVCNLGIEDFAAVTHENFRQWVIEDAFCAGRPNWNKVGATFTNKVHAFEAMKIRILNGGHQLIANTGELLSVEFISDCMDHLLIGPLFRKVALDEIAPLVDSVPGMSPAAYVDLVDSRFSNAQIVDTVQRVAFDGSSRQTGFILPTLRDALAEGSKMDGLVLSQAIWARMCEGTREDGSLIEPNDPNWNKLTAAAKIARTDPQAWLNQSDLYGDLANNIIFRSQFHCWLALIYSDGLETTLNTYLEG